MENLENKRARVDVRWTSKGKPHIWDLYHHLVNWSDLYTKDSGGYNSLTILKDFCSYTFLFYKEWDESKQMTIICNNYHSKEFRKLQIILRKYFKRYSPRFEKPRDFDKLNSESKLSQS